MVFLGPRLREDDAYGRVNDGYGRADDAYGRADDGYGREGGENGHFPWN